MAYSNAYSNTYSNALYRPSILELAQAGNCRALSYWMNSLFAAQGIHVQIQPAPDHFLKILVDFRKPKQKEACLNLQEQVTRLICYRLWTLNSEAIRGVRIVARMAGDSKVLWHVSVRINSPASLKVRRGQETQVRQMQVANQLRFRVLRSVFMSSITLAGFFIGYWLFYVEVGRLLARGRASETPVLSDNSGTNNSAANSEVVLPESASQPQNEADAAAQKPEFTVPEQFRGQVISQVDLPDSEKVIALTFDGGPNSDFTGQVLDVLKQYKVRATFFLSGTNVQQSPDMARRIVAEGHMVGNRGWSRTIENGKDLDLTHEVDETAKLIEQTTSVKPVLFRPPDGRLDNSLVAYAQERQYAVTLWSVDSQDALVAAPIVLDNVLRNVRPGRIVLLHDSMGANNQSATLQALPQLITALQQQGYRFVSVAEMLAMQKNEKQSDTKLPIRKPAIATASLVIDALAGSRSPATQNEQTNHGDAIPEAMQQH